MGEAKKRGVAAVQEALEALGVEALGGRVQVRWNQREAATPFGQMAYFAEFLNLTGLCGGGGRGGRWGGAVKSPRGGHAVRADGLLCRVSEPHGSLSALDRELSAAICKPERLQERGHSGHVVSVGALRALGPRAHW